MSQIYAGGNYATAIANIKAAAQARFTEQSDGTFALDVASLTLWLQQQFSQMWTDGEATDQSYAASAAQLAPQLVGTLAAAVDKRNFYSNSAWPIKTDLAISDSARVSAVAQAQGTLKRLSEDLTAYYSTLKDDIYNKIADYFNANVLGNIPAAVDRLVEDVTYIYTYVTDRGEESEPSPASAIVERDQNDTLTVAVGAPPAGRFITHFRLYRSNSNNTGAQFQYVPNPQDEDGWPIGTLSILDDKKNAELQEPCPSLLWNEPPSDLRGIVGGANGGMAGFRENEFCPCVPYKGYAWPVALRITTEFPIVGLAASGQDYFVGTRGRPSIISGADTQSLSHLKLDADQACVSRRSIVALRGGFMYASPDGLCLADIAGVKVITGPEGFNLFDRNAWQALNPESIFAAENEGCYVFHWDNGASSGMYSLDLQSGRLVALTNTGSALYRDSVTDRLYVATGTKINAIGGGANTRTAVWRSKRIVLPDEVNHSWVQADSDYEAPVTVRSYQDGVLTDTTTLTSREPQRLPDGNAREWEVEVESAARVTSVTLAINTEELKAV